MSNYLTKIQSVLALFLIHSLLGYAAPHFSKAGFFEVDDSPRSIYNFNPGWRFQKGDTEGAHLQDYDDSSWESANLPHGLEVLPENASGGRNYQGIAWYRKRFDAPEAKHLTLYFEAVMGRTEVWVNGHKMTEHFGGYLPFAVEITDVLQPTGNIIAVMTDNSDNKLYPPGKPQSGLDFSYFGGIYRDVFMITTQDVYITLPELSNEVAGGGVFVATTDINENSAQLEIGVELHNATSHAKHLKVVHTIESMDMQPITTITKSYTISKNESKQIQNKITINNAHFWHPNDPYLYYVKIEVFCDKERVDAVRTRFGIRLFEMRGSDGFYINKQPYGRKIIGANRHQDYVHVGNATPNSAQWRDVKLLRQGGCEVIRVGHYPQDPAFYDACDELGMFTTTANPGWHFFNFKDPIFEQRLYEDTRKLVRAGRNYASILMWETALNETPKQPGHVMHHMHELAHEEFPYPSMYTVTDYKEAISGGFDMHYHGEDSTFNSFNREYGDGWQVDNWTSQNAASRVKVEWGEKALLGQALLQAEELNGRYPTPSFRIGGAKWAGIDHQRGYHPDPFWGGLLNLYRLPKYAYYLYQSQYNSDYILDGATVGPMLFSCHEVTQLSPNDIVVFSNCDEVRIQWLDKDVVTATPSTDPKYADLPHPPFIFKNMYDFTEIRTEWRRRIPEVKMVIEGLINGKVVISETKDYAEQTVGIQLELATSSLPLVADHSDFIPIHATLVDGNGNRKVLASEYVHFVVEGPAELITSPQAYNNPMKTQLGIATALIRATGTSGTITVKAFSQGLKSAELSFESVPCKDQMLLDQTYLQNSKTTSESPLIIESTLDAPRGDAQDALDEINTLRKELVGKEQEIMELRNQLINN